MTQKKGKKKTVKRNAEANEASGSASELTALTATADEAAVLPIKELTETSTELSQDVVKLTTLPSMVEGEEKEGPPEEGEGMEEDETKEGEEIEMSEKTRKNRLKKLKKKQSQQAKQADPEAKANKDQQPKKAPLSAMARAALERLQLMKAQEEARRLEEEKIRLAEEERERKFEEEQRLLQEERERKRLVKLEKKELLRAENKLLSQKDKSQQEKNKVYIDQLRSMGLLPQLPEGEEKAKRKIVAERIKRKKPLMDTLLMEMALESSSPSSVEPTVEISMKNPSTEETLPIDVLENWEDILAEVDILDETQSPDISSSLLQKVFSSKSQREKIASPSLSSDSSLTSPSLLPVSTSSKVAVKQKSTDIPNLRSPVCCILGHVDTGKTKLLDKIRKTDVQDNEAGGITQQIGATFFPKDTLTEQCIKIDSSLEMHMPGLLIIDTPGHESFNNLRARGSSLCDIAILVVDIMHGLEPQTKESLGLLKGRNCPFVIALNKVDRLYGWKSSEWMPFRETMTMQPSFCQDEFEKRLDESIIQLKEEGINCDLYWKNNDIRHTVSIVPTSALTGEGLSDLLYLVVYLTQTIMTKSLIRQEALQCTILEVKNIDGLGITIDVILLNGILHEGDTIVVCGMSGPIVSTIRALLTPQPLKELRIKSEYIHHVEMEAAMGIKISAPGLDEAVAGTSLLVAEETEDIEELKEEVMEDMVDIFKSVDRSGCGVYVMASTLGSLEALLQFLKGSKIPVFGVNIGM
ncbi:putative translation initiation factor IF-2 [Cardiosporidium cionae]|uniref:Translation initiation factor IF-2 n=1 Tax=Cardiosporidium cionae TaxID=476202 RepID=A0ABQ7JAR5_9APIC|nr:putative translation initiation factor IF-2 [Cardiosporidium cionae]|eukprot:KAF8821071.1 putative translation initiation factor IF-2 [Cardiosporidium cionae]